jgi:hypothetical protein
MNVRALVLSLCTAALGLGIACGSDRFSAPDSGPPFAGGSIAAIDSGHGYRIDAGRGTTAPAQVFFHVSAATTYERINGRKAAVSDLVIGTTVAVWAASQMANALPPEITARHVLIYDSR